MDHIKIKQKTGSKGQAMTGQNCEIYINGQRLTSAINVQFGCDAKGHAKVKLEMLGNIDIEGNIEEIEEVYNESKTSEKIEEESGDDKRELSPEGLQGS